MAKGGNILKTVLDKWQSCPSIEDLNLKKVQNVSTSINGTNKLETVTNILEWQSQNIRYWFERADLCGYLSILSIIGFVIVLYWTSICSIKYLLILALFGIILIYINVLYLVPLITIFLLGTFLIFGYILKWNNPIYYLIIGSILGGFFINLIVTSAKYKHYIKKYSKWNSSELLAVLIRTFNINISVDIILKYRWAICRDYAKLSSVLLLNGGFKEVYQLTIPQHVVSAVYIDNKLYVLDQKLPLMRVDTWLEKFKKKSANCYKITCENSKVLFEPVGIVSKNICLKNSENDIINEEKIVFDLKKSLKIEFNGEKSGKILEINDFPKNLAKYYDKNTHLSIIRLMRNRIDSELGMNIENITNIDLELDNDDINLKIYLK